MRAARLRRVATFKSMSKEADAGGQVNVVLTDVYQTRCDPVYSMETIDEEGTTGVGKKVTIVCRYNALLKDCDYVEVEGDNYRIMSAIPDRWNRTAEVIAHVQP